MQFYFCLFFYLYLFSFNLFFKHIVSNICNRFYSVFFIGFTYNYCSICKNLLCIGRYKLVSAVLCFIIKCCFMVLFSVRRREFFVKYCITGGDVKCTMN